VFFCDCAALSCRAAEVITEMTKQANFWIGNVWRDDDELFNIQFYATV